MTAHPPAPPVAAPRRGPTEAERLARAGLSRAAEPGLPQVGALVRAVGAEEAWAALRDGSRRLPAALAGAAARAARADPDGDLAAAEACGGRLICPGEADWPRALAELGPREPVALWVRGAAKLTALAEQAIAVVGTRAASEYGLYVAGELAAGLADRGWAVVSGGAYGIDGAAHRGCVVMAGVTAAVLACGVDVCYPRGHAALFERIAASGLLVSPYPPGAAPYRVRFLNRNGLIAALTAGTVVVEAAHRSGALNTAAHAGRLGRPVMAVPGPVTAATSAGCHRLIRDLRASLVAGVEEVIETVGRLTLDLAPPPPPSRAPRDDLPAEAALVLDATPANRATEASRIAVAAGVDPATVLAALGLLEGLGLAERRGSGWRLSAAARPAARAGAPPGRRGDPGPGGAGRPAGDGRGAPA